MAKQLLSMLMLLMLFGNARTTAQTVSINTASGTSGNAFLGTSNYAANECIYTEAEIGAANFTTSGSAIQEIGFFVSTVGINTTFNNVTIYMKDVPLTTTSFTSGSYSTAGYTQVYSGSVTLAATGWNTITLTTPYVRTAGTNLQVLVERFDNTVHTGYVYSCSNGNNTSTTLTTTRRHNSTTMPTTLTTSAFRQSIQLKHNLNNNLGVSNIYTLGTVPVLFNDIPAIEANVYNDGVNTMSNIPLVLTMTGANSFSDTQYVTLLPNTSQIVTFTPFLYTTQGATVITVSLPNDDNNSDNSQVWNQTVGQNLFSYKEPTQSNQPGGIGFNGGTGQAVAKFNLGTLGDLNEVKVDFATSGNPFQVVVYDASGAGGAPGSTPLWVSPVYTTVAGTAFVPVSPVLTLPPGDFYIGAMQTGTTNFQFAYQTETPIRPNTFYYGAVTNPVWTAFSGAQPFRFAIEAQFYVPQPPNCATAHSPADQAVHVDAVTTTNLSWLSGGGGATSYDVFFGTTYPPPYVGSTTTTTFPVSLLPSTTYYWHVLATNGSGSAIGCDTLEFKTACPEPNSLSAINVTANAADLQWVEPGTATTWAIEYGPMPLTPGTGTIVYATSLPAYSILSGLTPATTYEYSVRSICGAGDTSLAVLDTFTTPCLTFTAPYAENFNLTSGTTPPNCWTVTAASNGGTWQYAANMNNGYGAVTADHTGNSGGFAWVDGSSPIITGQVTMLTSPIIDISALTIPQVRYYVVSYYNQATYGVNNNKLILEAWDNNISDWIQLDSIQQIFSSTAWEERIVSLASVSSTTTQLRFRFEGAALTTFYNDIFIDDVHVENMATCAASTSLSTANVTTNSADLSWVSTSSAGLWEINYDAGNSFAAGSGTSVFTTTPPPYSWSVATPTGMIYSYFVRDVCGVGDTSAWSSRGLINLLLPNDDASGALPLTVGGGCSGNPYDNTMGTQNTAANEPYPSCNNYSTGHHTVWFKFVAPASGAVRVSTDILPAGTHTDTKIGLFSATDSSDYSTFSIIACDEDGGVNTAYNSIVFATGLTGGTTYYVQVDGWSIGAYGTFCVTVDELNSSMLQTASTSCATAQIPEGSNTAYTGWQPLITTGGQLIALVRNPSGGSVVNYTASQTINTGTTRNDNGQYYLDRNYLINNSSISTPVDVQLFFTAAEQSALQGVDANATLANLNVTKQSGTTCQANHNAANGTNTALLQTGNGNVNGVNWITVQTSSFSNFYIMSGIDPLVIQLGSITAMNIGAANKVEWTTLSEERSDKFELERSADGKHFAKIYEKQANGEASRYTYMDNNPIKGMNYYRLRMTESNGQATYSEVVTAFVKSNGFEVNAYPNPVSHDLTVQVSGVQGADATVQVMDVTGKVIRTVKMTGNVATLNMSSLANGIYLIKYSDADHTQTIRVNKQ